jgi:hypothetical protein
VSFLSGDAPREKVKLAKRIFSAKAGPMASTEKFAPEKF